MITIIFSIFTYKQILYGTISISDYDIEVADDFTTLYMKVSIVNYCIKCHNKEMILTDEMFL